MPKTTQELYEELLAKGDAAQQQANDLLAQYDARGPFSYNAATDPLFQSVKDQYVHQGQRAMQDTMGQAAGLTGGYGSSYSQSVGNQAYNEYLTKLNEQIPALAQQARTAYDNEGQRMLDRYNLALNAANTAYGQGRDALGDLRYEQEWAQQQKEYADQQAYQQWQMNRANQSDARDYAMMLIQMGRVPDAATLQAAGLSAGDAKFMAQYYAAQLAGTGSTGGSNPSYTPGKTPAKTPAKDKEKDDGNEQPATVYPVIKPAQQNTLLTYAQTHSKADFDAFFQKNFGNAPNAQEVYNWIKQQILKAGAGTGTGGAYGGGGKNLDVLS